MNGPGQSQFCTTKAMDRWEGDTERFGMNVLVCAYNIPVESAVEFAVYRQRLHGLLTLLLFLSPCSRGLVL